MEHAVERIWSQFQNFILNQQQTNCDALEKNLVGLVEAFEPSPHDYSVRQNIIFGLNRILQIAFPAPSRVYVEPYGSFVSGTFLKNSDLDLALNGQLEVGLLPSRIASELRNEWRAISTVPLETLDRESRTMLLTAVSQAFVAANALAGPFEAVFHARVPIIKFSVWDPSGPPGVSCINCDVCVATPGCSFKAKVIRAVGAISPRFRQLFRLAKLWAQVHSMNDAAAGTFNTWSLTLMVVFALQTCRPAVLPPLWRCFHGEEPPASAPRLMQGEELAGAELEAALATCTARCQSLKASGFGSDCHLSLMQLFAWFMELHHGIFRDWDVHSGQLRDWRISPWLGRLWESKFKVQYLVRIEDPFDLTDNTARTVGSVAANDGTLPTIRRVLQISQGLMADVIMGRAHAPAFLWLFTYEAASHLDLELLMELGIAAQWLGEALMVARQMGPVAAHMHLMAKIGSSGMQGTVQLTGR